MSSSSSSDQTPSPQPMIKVKPIPKENHERQQVRRGRVRMFDHHEHKSSLTYRSRKHSPIPSTSQQQSLSEEQLKVANQATTANKKSDNLTVIVRVRPKQRSENVSIAKNIIELIDSKTLTFDPEEPKPEFYFRGIKQNNTLHDGTQKSNKNMSFAFDTIYGPEHTNVEIFENSLQPLIAELMSGYSCSIFTYGSTGSGKTYTMLGNVTQPGLTYLMTMELYKRIDDEVAGGSGQAELHVSYYEIYNESIKDLLNPSNSTLTIRDNGSNGISIANLTTHKPKDASAMLNLLFSGNSNRTQHSTDHNQESSRSHAIFEINLSLRCEDSTPSSSGHTPTCSAHTQYSTISSKLFMIDLAGSERSNSACGSSTHTRNREGSNINRSLLALGNVINALADGKGFVPYRDSKLTRILKDSLGGDCKTVMITNVSPTSLQYDDTYNSLKYANRAKNIKITPKKSTPMPTMTTTMVEEQDGEEKLPCECGCQAELIKKLQADKEALIQAIKDQREANQRLSEDLEATTKGTCGCKNKPKEDGDVVVTKTSPSQSNTSPIISTEQVINDPSLLDSFLSTLGHKQSNEQQYIEACLKAKETEKSLKWMDWKIESLRSLESFQLTQPCLIQLQSEYDSISKNYELAKNQASLAKQVMDYSEEELCRLQLYSLAEEKRDDPFIAITLGELLDYKALEREAETSDSITSHYLTLSRSLACEKLNVEANLTSAMQFAQELMELINDNGLKLNEKEKKQFDKLFKCTFGSEQFGCIQTTQTNKGNDKTWTEFTNNRHYPKDLVDSMEKLMELIQDPIKIEDETSTSSTSLHCSSQSHPNELKRGKTFCIDRNCRKDEDGLVEDEGLMTNNNDSTNKNPCSCQSCTRVVAPTGTSITTMHNGHRSICDSNKMESSVSNSSIQSLQSTISGISAASEDPSLSSSHGYELKRGQTFCINSYGKKEVSSKDHEWLQEKSKVAGKKEHNADSSSSVSIKTLYEHPRIRKTKMKDDAKSSASGRKKLQCHVDHQDEKMLKIKKSTQKHSTSNDKKKLETIITLTIDKI